MNSRLKIIIVVSVSIFFIILGAFVYAFLTRPEEQLILQNTNEIVEDLPQTTSGTFVITNELIQKGSVQKENLLEGVLLQEIGSSFIPEIQNNSGNAYIISDTGEVFQYVNGKASSLFVFDQPVAKIAVSPNGDMALVKTQTDFNYLYVIATGESKTLPEEIRDFAWSPDGNKIAYQYFDVFDRNYGIFISDPDATNFEKLVSFEKDDEFSEYNLLFWSRDDHIVYQPPSLSIEGTGLYSVSIKTKEESSLVVNDTAQSFIASGDKILYTVFSVGADGSEGTFVLREYDFVTQKTIDIDVEALASNCVYVEEDVVCAVSDDLFSNNPSEILVRYNHESQAVVPLTQIADKSVNYEELQFIDTLNEIVYYNGTTSSLEKISLDK